MRETDLPLLPGREAALGRLDAWLDEVATRGPRFVLVRGAPEDAPDRVVAAFAEGARGRGHPVFFARGGHHGALASFRDVAAEAHRWLRRHGRRPPVHLPRPVDAAGPTGREHRLVALERLSASLAAATTERPGVLVLEEGHRGGRGMLEVLAWLLGGDAAPFELGLAPDAPRLLVATSVPDDAPELVVDLPERLRRTLRVGPLEEEALARLLASPALVRRIAERTRGHVRLLDALLAPEPRDDGAQAALEVLAVLARPAPAAELARLGDVDADPAPIEARLAERPEVARDADGRWRFVEVGAREWVYRSIPAARRAALHRRAARGTGPLEAVRHARIANDCATLVRLAPAAAERLAADGAPEAAAELLESTLEHLPADDALPLRAHLADLLWAVGDWPAALVHAEAVAALGPDDPRALLRVARLLEGMGRHAAAERTLDQAFARATDPSDARIRLEVDVRRADALLRNHDLPGARAVARRVLEHAEDGDELRLDARNVLGKVALHGGEVERAASLFEALADDAAAVGNGRYEARALTNLGIALATQGEVGRARRQLERAIDVGSRCQAPFQRAVALRNLAWLDHVVGDLDAALRGYQRAVGAFKRLGDRDVLVRLAGNLAVLHLARGDLERAEGLEHFAWSLLDDESPAVVRAEVVCHAAVIALAGGRVDRARRLFEEVEALGAELTPWLATSTALGLAEVAMEEGRLGEVRQRLARIEDAAYPLVPVRKALLEAELARGCGEPAVPRCRLALDLAEAAGHPLRTVEALGLLGEALADEGRWDEVRAIRDRVARERGDTPWPPPLARRIATLDARAAAASPSQERPGPAAATPAAVDRLVGSSSPMRAVRALVTRVGASEGAVLVTGESGTGKELVARAVHASSPRAQRPFVSVNCAAFVDTLLPSELFGHERGAFTGADRRRRGKFELADGGTLFLDEVGDVSPAMQAALLRVLQDGTFHRVGGTETVRVDVRIVSATNRDLEHLVSTGRFREDLLYRLRVVEVHTPPLRERIADLPELVERLLDRIASESRGPRRQVSEAALDRLAEHSWPGNVRELENALRAAAALAEGELLRPEDFALRPPSFRTPSAYPVGEARVADGRGASLASLFYAELRSGDGSIYDLRRALERDLIARALAEAGGNITRAAALLGMKRPRLSQLVSEHGLKGHGDPR